MEKGRAQGAEWVIAEMEAAADQDVNTHRSILPYQFLF